jgi:hypothetical protein
VGLNGLVKRCFRQGDEPYLHLYPHSSSGRPGMPFQGRGPRQRRTRQRPRYGLNLACGRPCALVQLMRLTLFLVVDFAAGMSAAVAITLPELGTQRNLRGLS